MLITTCEPGRKRFLPASLRRIARSLVAATVLALALSGCQSLYLHTDAAQQATAQVKSELDKVNLASVFENESAYLDDLRKREYDAVAESLAAQRDDSVLRMLRGRGGENGDGRTFLASRIDGYLRTITGTSDRGGGLKLWTVIRNSYEGISASKTLADSLAENLETNRKQLQAPATNIPELLSPSGISLDQAIKAAQDVTKEIQTKKAAATAARDELAAGLKKAADDLSAGNASQKTFTDLLKKMNDLLKEAKDEANPYLGLYVSETVLDSLDHLVEVTDTKGIDAATDSKARATIGFVHAAFGVGDAFSNPPRVPHPNALAATKAWLRYVASQSDTEFARARANEEVLRAQVAAVAQQVYYLSRAGEALEPVRSTPFLEADEGLAKLLASKDSRTSTAASAALYYYASAWTRGFIPAQQLRQVAPLVERHAKLEQSRQAGEAWLGTLKPAVATLAAYGEGGLDPHVIAELLQVLGIGAIAVGVN